MKRLFRRLRISKGRLDPESTSAHYNRQRSLAAYAFTKDYLADRLVLDAGCGAGHGTVFISQEAKKVIGVDLDFPAVSYCGKYYPPGNLYFICADLLRMPFTSGTFEVVISLQVIEHLQRPDIYFKEIQRILRPNGIFFLATLNRTQSSAGLHPDHVKEYDFSEFRDTVTPFFPNASFYGLFGNERYLSVRQVEARFGRLFLKMDPLGVRRLLPKTLWEWIYTFCTLCVNQYVTWRRPLAKELTIADFQIGSSPLEKALDFIAVCEKE